jgi:hypothetical protein
MDLGKAKGDMAVMGALENERDTKSNEGSPDCPEYMYTKLLSIIQTLIMHQRNFYNCGQ